MTLPREVLKYIMESTSGDSQKSIDLIMEYETIRQKIARRNQTIADIRRDSEARIRELMKEEICKHEVRKVHGDPSGNGDTVEECLVCGLFMRERAPRFT